MGGTSRKIVNIADDEIIVECDQEEVETARAALEKAMVSAGEEFVKAVPIKVDTRVAQAWSQA